MPAQCHTFKHPNHGRRKVVAAFDGGRMSSDGGALLLRAADSVLQLTQRLATCFTDYRNPSRCEHSVRALVAQRVLALSLGYQDVNDHDTLRTDSLLALAVQRTDVTGGQPRTRARPRAFAGRLEYAEPARAGHSGVGRGAPLQADRGRCGRDGRAAGGPVCGAAGGDPGGNRAECGRHR